MPGLEPRRGHPGGRSGVLPERSSWRRRPSFSFRSPLFLLGPAFHGSGPVVRPAGRQGGCAPSPAISRAYPVTARMASRTVSPSRFCLASISVLELSIDRIFSVNSCPAIRCLRAPARAVSRSISSMIPAMRLGVVMAGFFPMSGRSAGAGSRPPALLLHSAGRPGETPLPSLVSLLAACVHRPGLVMTCSGRVQPGPARLAGMCSGLGWRTGFPRAAPAV